MNVHAAASDIKWYGTDFQPAHVELAKELAAVSGADIEISGQSFMEFCSRKDLPDFDYICLHGVWTWISSENRHIIIDFLKRKLKIGGIAYISYNALPGWSNMIALRDNMMAHIDRVADPSEDLRDQVKTALLFVNQLLAASPAFTQANPRAQGRLEQLQKQDAEYLTHEFFNKNWAPMTFSSVHRLLEPAELTYVGSADYLNNIDLVHLNKTQLKLLNGITDSTLRETSRDFLLNTSFRSDIWIKQPNKLSAQERSRLIREQRLIKVKAAENPPRHISTELGKVTLKLAIYKPILDALSGYQIRTIGEIEADCKSQKISLEQIVQAVLVLSNQGFIAPIEKNKRINKAYPQTERLNTYLLDKAASNQNYEVLASPVMGGGIAIGSKEQLFILALRHGNITPQDCADFIWNTLTAQGHTLQFQGQALDKPEDALTRLTSDTKNIFDKHHNLLKALKIIE